MFSSFKLESSDSVCENNLKIFYAPPYEFEIWQYSKANADHIRGSTSEFSWENRFSNTDSNQKVHLFNETIKNILSNFTPHDTIVCDDRDPHGSTAKLKT